MRFYRLILRLYPRSFRESYGDELEAVARSRVRETHGFLATMLFVIEVTADTLVSAAGSHADLVRADLRSAFRTLRRSPAFAVTVMSVAALGIGATVAVFQYRVRWGWRSTSCRMRRTVAGLISGTILSATA